MMSMSTIVDILGTFSSLTGRPNYLIDRDSITPEYLIDVFNNNKYPMLWFNSIMGENYKPLDVFPELEDASYQNYILETDANVWCTFIHEGTSLKHIAGFYTYDGNIPPTSIYDCKSFTVMYPNSSLKDSSGDLDYTSDFYLNTLPIGSGAGGDKILLGNFPANTGIGLFIIKNGWQYIDNILNKPIDQVNSEYIVYYSTPMLNWTYFPQSLIIPNEAKNKCTFMFEETEATAESDFNDVILTLSSDGQIGSSDSSGSGTSSNSNATGGSGVMIGLPVTRVNDKGVGFCFVCKVPVITVHIEGDPITFADGLPVTRLNDMSMCSCGHIGKNYTASILTDSASSKPIHRITDIITWSGVAISVEGSPITFSL